MVRGDVLGTSAPVALEDAGDMEDVVCQRENTGCPCRACQTNMFSDVVEKSTVDGDIDKAGVAGNYHADAGWYTRAIACRVGLELDEEYNKLPDRDRRLRGQSKETEVGQR
jgi:hypothetical protein